MKKIERGPLTDEEVEEVQAILLSALARSRPSTEVIPCVAPSNDIDASSDTAA